MPVTPTEKLIGQAGLAYLLKYSDPKFIFTALTELEDLFVKRIKDKLESFKADMEITEPPPVVPAYNPGDRKFYVVIVEAQLNSADAQGLGYNKREFQFQPNEDDPNTLYTYMERSGNASYTVEIFVRALTRASVCYIADWVFAALNDPIVQALDGGIQIPYNAIRFGGRIQELSTGQGAPDALDKFWGMTFTIPGIIIPWQRMYRMEGPDITTFSYEITRTDLSEI